MPPVRPCPACGRHVLGIAASCPHCDTTLRTRSPIRTAAALALGLAVAGAPGCAGDETTTKTGETGTTETGTTETGTTTSVDYGTSGYTETGTTETGTTETGTTETANTGDTGTTTSVDYGVTY